MPKPSDHPIFDGIMTIAAAVQTAEQSADTGIISTAELIIATLKTQNDHGLAPSLAEPALVKLRRAMDAHLEGRTAIVEAHAEYRRIAASLGATPTSFGPTWPCTQRSVRTTTPLAAAA
ncbi:hypothetical protein [Sphingobium sp. BS19]|uniref:hypothetical protein n=1 Tax=Sphingobium sp. BS19 TaxID=3018973 RepID=UPI0022EED46A|nr:hypothetical protein [Sphingobium sp. BS19]GLI99077.1 hypothetical protein Sbs19_28950 [Sphingobium sp. BS19]